MASLEETEITFQTQENIGSDSANDLTSFQFVPDKIVDFSISQDGQRSYRVRWKDSWLTEELLALTYQHLINEFWSATVAVSKSKEKTKSKKSNIKLISKQDDFDNQYQQIVSQSQQIDGSVPDASSAINLKDIGEAASAAQLLEQNNTILKAQTATSKVSNETVDPNSLSSIVVNADVSLAVSDLQYQEMNPALLTNQPLPKYQQALQQSITVQQQDLIENEQGKVTFPKHVFSQARYVSKKQQHQYNADQQRVQCDICQKSLKTKKMLWAHKVAVHYGGNFPCDVCGKKCITGAELRRHMTSHSSERKFVCQYCGLAYKRWSHLYQHLRVHEEEKNFRCDVCHNNFKVQSELKDHCFAEHSNGEMVQCSVCKHKLQTPLAVYYHSMKHTGTRDFICEICGSNFKRKQHLVTHMKTHLTEKKAADGTTEVYNCQACDKSFELKMELKAHCDSDHPCDGTSDVIMCKTCNKRLNVSHSVYLHGLRHCGVREFQCEECNQLFKRKAHLLRHQMDRHPAVPRERKKRSVLSDTIVCTLCTRTFIYKAALIKHMAMQHGIFPKANGEFVVKKCMKKRHQCEVCSKRFKSKCNLAKHKVNKHGTNAEGSDSKMEIELQENSTQESKIEDHSLTAVVNCIPKNDAASEITSTAENSISVGRTDMPEKIEIESSQSDAESSNLSVYTPPPGVQSAVSLATVPRQVITVDQETGQIILMQTEHIPESSLVQGVSTTNDSEKEHLIPLIVSSTATMSNENHQIINSQSNLSSFGSQNVDDSDLSSMSAVVSHSISQGVPIGQMMNQDVVSLSTLPMQTGINEGQNVLDFTQGNSEQIVVLLSALNAQNMEQL